MPPPSHPQICTRQSPSSHQQSRSPRHTGGPSRHEHVPSSQHVLFLAKSSSFFQILLDPARPSGSSPNSSFPRPPRSRDPCSNTALCVGASWRPWGQSTGPTKQGSANSMLRELEVRRLPKDSAHSPSPPSLSEQAHGLDGVKITSSLKD